LGQSTAIASTVDFINRVGNSDVAGDQLLCSTSFSGIGLHFVQHIYSKIVQVGPGYFIRT